MMKPWMNALVQLTLIFLVSTDAFQPTNPLNLANGNQKAKQSSCSTHRQTIFLRRTSTSDSFTQLGDDSKPTAFESSPSKIPTSWDFIKFMIPVFAMYLANPLLSMVDTAAVGRWCDSKALASLGPGTAVCDMMCYLASFMAVATTNLFAAALARGDSAGARRVASVAIALSAAIGAALTALLACWATPILAAFTGAAAADTLPLSVAYVAARAAGTLPALVATVAQAALIGARDAASPLRCVTLQSVINIAGDYLLVGPLGTGVAGAAWATVAAQWAGCAYLLRALARTLDAIDTPLPPAAGSAAAAAGSPPTAAGA
jgi:Na+-driven multidrug efflux pump